MITPEKYDKVQILLGRKGRPRPKKYNFAFRGLIRCGECGAMVTAEEKNQIICSKCKYKFSSIIDMNAQGVTLQLKRWKNQQF